MALLPSLWRHAAWIAAPALVASAMLLAHCIAGVLRNERQARIATLPLVATQEVEIPRAGRLVLATQGPILSRRFAGLRYALVGPDGREVPGRPSIFRMRAFTYALSVRMGIWKPQNDFALYPISVRAMASSPMVTCSPVEATTSSSRSLGSSEIWCASPSSRFVSPDMAETTTTTSFPWSFVRATRFAQFLIFSIVPTEVPPYFWTMSAIACVTLLAGSVGTAPGTFRTWAGPGRRPRSPCGPRPKP
jgi:hypothetical protein